MCPGSTSTALCAQMRTADSRVGCPLSGWRDDTPAAMRVALQWAHQDGVDFFFFDWFYEADPLLNVALGNYLLC